MTGKTTRMFAETSEIPLVLARQISEGLPVYFETAEWLRGLSPGLFVTCARGTSDHAATYFKYLMEMSTGIPVASIGPSVASVFDAPLKLEGGVCLTISQSGGSPDLVALQAAAARGGARTIALLNTVDSPVGTAAERVLPSLAGPELSVAATKSFVASLFAVAALHARLNRDDALEDALRQLPAIAEKALAFEWQGLCGSSMQAATAFVVSRGPGLALAGEIALKLKEVARLHAEAFSAAEVRHGPMALAAKELAVLAFVTDDASRQSVVDSARSLATAGATVAVAGANVTGCASLPTAQSPHPLLTPLCQAITFYRFAEAFARARGLDPDAPLHLCKVTETI